MRTLEDFREETRRNERYFWALVRKAERRERTFSQLYECSRCGKLVNQFHERNCFDLRAADISMQEKLDRKDELFNDKTWVELIIDD